MNSTSIYQSTAPAWPHWMFRIVATLAAALLFAQSILAGLFIGSHNKTAFALHEYNGILSVAIVLVLVIAAVLSVWPGRGARGVILATVALLVITAAQTAAGFAKLTAVHVPLAIVLIGLAVAMAVAAWRRGVPARES